MEVMHGRRAGETINIVAPQLSVQDELDILENDEMTDMAGVSPYPSAKSMLGLLSSKQWAIVTSGSLRVASARMKHVGLPRPEIFITAEDVSVGKPAPDGYLLASRRLGVKPSACVVVEDAPAGIQAGTSAGMKVIAVASSIPMDALQQADIVVQRLEEIKLQITNQGITIQIND
jgi:sugar-phosphatase